LLIRSAYAMQTTPEIYGTISEFDRGFVGCGEDRNQRL